MNKRGTLLWEGGEVKKSGETLFSPQCSYGKKVLKQAEETGLQACVGGVLCKRTRSKIFRNFHAAPEKKEGGEVGGERGGP